MANELIKRFEGFSAKPYLCPAGKWTRGYGRTIGIKKNSPPITKEDAAAELDAYVRSAILPLIERSVKVPLNKHQTDALASFIYNIGEGNFRASSLLEKLNAGDYQGAADEFLRWNKATVSGKKIVLPGLKARREAERELFLQQPAAKKPLKHSRTIKGAKVAAGATVLGVAADVIEQAEPAYPLLQTMAMYAPYLLAVLALAGVAYVVYARWDDHKKGAR